MKSIKIDKNKTQVSIQGNFIYKIKCYLLAWFFIFIFKFEFSEIILYKVYRKLIDNDNIHPLKAEQIINSFLFKNTVIAGRLLPYIKFN